MTYPVVNLRQGPSTREIIVYSTIAVYIDSASSENLSDALLEQSRRERAAKTNPQSSATAAAEWPRRSRQRWRRLRQSRRGRSARRHDHARRWPLQDSAQDC